MYMKLKVLEEINLILSKKSTYPSEAWRSLFALNTAIKVLGMANTVHHNDNHNAQRMNNSKYKSCITSLM